MDALCRYIGGGSVTHNGQNLLFKKLSIGAST